MALDEPQDTDEILEGDGYKVVVKRELLDQAGGLTIDFQDFGWSSGFTIRAGTEPEGGCGSCSC